MNQFSDIFNANWNFLLIQGGVSSGKSQLGLMLAHKMIERNIDERSLSVSDLLNSKNMAILTERLPVSMNDPLFLKIKNRSHLIEYITALDVFDKVRQLYEYQGINYIFLDYINLLTHQYDNFEKIIEFMTKNNMKGVFIENTAKLKQYDFNLYKKSDVILRTTMSKTESQCLEVGVLKFFNAYIQKPPEFSIRMKDL